MNRLEQKYKDLCNTPSDVNEYLPILKKYAKECQNITEMGIESLILTYALMMGNPKKFFGIYAESFVDPAGFGNNLQQIIDIATENNIQFDFIFGDTKHIEIEETELLLIDTYHSYDQLKTELEKHSPKVKKYIIIHNTTSFRDFGQNKIGDIDYGTKGLWSAIEEFLQSNIKWIIYASYSNKNGLTILKRVTREYNA